MNQLWKKVLDGIESACSGAGCRLTEDQKLIIAGVLAVWLNTAAKRNKD